MQIESLFDELPAMDKEAVQQGKEKNIFDGHHIIRDGKDVFIPREHKHAVNH